MHFGDFLYFIDNIYLNQLQTNPTYKYVYLMSLFLFRKLNFKREK